jgi:hypothetical protein
MEGALILHRGYWHVCFGLSAAWPSESAAEAKHPTF